MTCSTRICAPRARRTLILAVAVAATTVGPSALGLETTARAQERAAAARAYSNAQAAELAGDHARAAELYELADFTAPTPEALRGAVRMRLKAGQPAIAASHAETLLDRYPNDDKSRELAEQVLEDTKDQLGRVTVECVPECEVEVDGMAMSRERAPRHVVYLTPGTSTVLASFPNGTIRDREVEARAGSEQQVRFRMPDAPKPESAQPPAAGAAPRGDVDDTGIHRGVVLGAMAVSLGVAGAAVWSGIDTENLAEEYRERPTREAYDDGLDRQLRTNILAGVAGAAGLATVVLAFFTDWDGPPDDDTQVSFGASPTGGSVHLQGRF